MECERCRQQVDLYLDGELPAAEAAAFEAALAHCPDCAAALAERRLLRAALRETVYRPAPEGLRAALFPQAAAPEPAAAEPSAVVPLPQRGASSPGARQGARPAASLREWMRRAAILLLAVGAGFVAGQFESRTGQQAADIDAQVVAGFLRLSASEHPVDVASSDHHTVKPWFDGRITYAPPVHDLTDAGFPLQGGRIDVIDGGKVAVLVYRRGRHEIALYLWPETGAAQAPASLQRDGYGIRRWRADGFAFRAISDVSAPELDAFVGALRERLATGG